MAAGVFKRGTLDSEEYFMHRVDRYIYSFFLAAAIVTPALIVAEAKAQEAAVQVRVYDRDHRDATSSVRLRRR